MSAPSTAVRLNPFKGCEGPEGDAVPWNRYGRLLARRPDFTLDPLLHAGCYYVQDSSAQYVGYVFRKLLTDNNLGSASGKRLSVLDLCAAPGGKTGDLAASLRERCGSNFLLVANEVIRRRAAVLRDNMARWGDQQVKVVSADPSFFGRRMEGVFDIVLADVPCSGEGMFRKDPKALEDRSEQTVELCAARQKRILADMWPALREGGILIYSTCTYEERENDDNLEWAARNLGGEIFAPENPFASFGVRSTRSGVILRAGEVPGEGQWVGALRKTSTQPPYEPREMPFELRRDEADRVLEINYSPEYPVVELSVEQALKYLHRDSLYLPEAPRGVIIAAYRGHPLGLAKNLGSRCNNLLPKGRRILMDINI